MNPNIAQAGIATRFKPGQSGNPAGPRKRVPLTRALELVARTRVPQGPKAGRKWWTAMALGLAEAAANGDAAAFREYRNTIQGLPQGERDDSGPPQITINLISVAPSKQAAESQQIVVHTEEIGKTN